ncbi:MAG: DUF2911 domain-containing protein [Bacteroidota bacterium]|nr:DUF2911 domain-containing protein [Chitinophagaceae bacterium]MDZ4808171.1 DUF2911 domain-containing protein [Bacteroidota bacterium]
MKQLFFSLLTLITVGACGQSDKSKRPSPPAIVTETVSSGAIVTIDYSQPSLKGRKIGTELAPYGQVWRTGANEATVFEVSKDVKIEGQSLPAGKYGLYSIPGETEWTIIFNKTWKQWGTQYKEADDALRVKVSPAKVDALNEKMTFVIDKSGKISLSWGDTVVAFMVK